MASFVVVQLRRELWRRRREALISALALAVGVGVVITVAAASAGVAAAQTAVLHSLYGVGTDITVTSSESAGRTAVPSTLVPDHGPLDQSVVDSIARLPGVARVAPGLSLTELGDGRDFVRVAGVDTEHPDLGPMGSVVSGRSLAGSDTAVVSAGYAAAAGLSLGSRVTVDDVAFTVVGTVPGGNVDVYVPLPAAQRLSGTRIDVIYVAAVDATAVSVVRAAIARRVPGVTVAAASGLAGAVSGSLGTAARLVDDLGRWVAVAVLVAAFAVAALSTLAAVGRRVREFGTLRALGWRAERIVAQIACESLVIGIVGAATGIALGFAGVRAVDAVALSAMSVSVHLNAQVGATALGSAVGLAVAGALAAGSFGAWRAARLTPAHAFAHVN